MRDLYAVLASYPPDCQPANVEPLGAAGGMSGAQFWRISVVRGSPDDTVVRGSPPVVRGSPDPAQPRTLILRRWPTEHPSPEWLRFIHAVLRHAATRGIGFLPIPVTTSDGQSFIQHGGYLWELAPWMPGSADYERSPRIEKLRAAMTALAQFHIALADFQTSPEKAATQRVAGAAPAPVRHLTRLRGLTHDQINDFTRSIHDTIWPDLTPLARQFVAALPQAVPPAITQLEPLANVRLPLQPCLRDIWHDHVLFTGDEVTGLVDFGGVDVDTPATDIARLLGSFSPPRPGEGLPETWQIGLTAYTAARPLSCDETAATHALDTSGAILAGCNWIRWIYIDGRQFENHAQVVERFRRILARCTLPHSPRSGGSA